MVIDTFWEEFHVFDINGIVDNILYLNMLKYSDKLEKNSQTRNSFSHSSGITHFEISTSGPH